MKRKIHELETAASAENLPKVQSFVDTLLEENGCPFKVQMQIDIAVEEVFVNIANYAYPNGSGTAGIAADVTPDHAELTFTDSGIPYDPLAKQDPDITLSAEERQIGGLGIFMTKNLMDELSYQYKDGKNILIMKKSF